MITMNDDDLGALVRAADPLRDATPDLPDVRDEVRAALTWNLRHAEPADADPADDNTGVTDLDARRHRTRRRRLLIAAVAATGIAASIVVPLVVPGGTTGGPTSASARALHELAAGVRAHAGGSPSTTTTVGESLSWVETRTGRAFYRQRVVMTSVEDAGGTTFTSTWDPPRFLTAADARRAQHVVGEPIPSGTQVWTDSCSTDPKCHPNAAELAALPTTRAGLERSIARDDLGGCEGGPGCRWADIVGYIVTPGVSTGTRAAAFDLLATAPGVSVLGYRTVDGRRGLAVRSIYGNEGKDLDEVDVFDVQDGTLLSQEQYLTAAYNADEGPLPVPLGTLIGSQHRTG